MKDWLNIQFVLLIAMLAALAGNVWFVSSWVYGSADASGFDDLDIVFLTTEDCEECFSLDAFREYFISNGVNEKQIKEVDYDSYQGKKLLKEYDITQVPTVVVEGDVASFEFMQGLVESVGEMREDAFVVTKLQPPYRDLEQDDLIGEFEVVLLADETCTECYNVEDHHQVLERLAMNPSSMRTIDISSEEGKKLIHDYVISAVPTILFRGELEAYSSFQQIWADVGTVEADGTHVLRQGVEQMGTYKTLPEGDVITLEEPTS